MEIADSSVLAGTKGFAMMRAMRIFAALICAVALISSARSEPLSPADREALLESLGKIRETVDSRVDARFSMALSTYRDAMASDEAAMDFYLKCTEKLNFTDQNKKGSDFREWKNQQDNHMSDPGFKLALRYQLQWLTLTLRASSEKIEIESLAPDAQEVVDNIMTNAEKLKHQEKTLSQPVTSTVFARIFEINGPKKNNWPLSPLQLDAVYEQLFFPPLRNSAHIDKLAAAWVRRINQEKIKIDVFAEAERQDKKDKKDKRVGMASADKSPEHDKFMEEVVPELQWQMEMDLFRSGDESGAAKRMLLHIDKYITHKSSGAWTDAFKSLLTPKPAAPAVGSTADSVP